MTQKRLMRRFTKTHKTKMNAKTDINKEIKAISTILDNKYMLEEQKKVLTDRVAVLKARLEELNNDVSTLFIKDDNTEYLKKNLSATARYVEDRCASEYRRAYNLSSDDRVKLSTFNIDVALLIQEKSKQTTKQ